MKIYLCVPYSQDPARGFIAANEWTAKLWLMGYKIFSPISHSHPVYIQSLKSENPLPANLDFWLDKDLYQIDYCDVLVVLEIEGWSKSEGVAKEIKYAKKIGKPIYMLHPEREPAIIRIELAGYENVN